MLTLRTRRVVCILALLGAAVAACGQFDSPPPSDLASQTPTVSEVMERGTEVAFKICGSAGSWERPSEEEQTSVWESGRYAGADEEVLIYPWRHDFFLNYGSASVEQDLTNLSGLWTLPEGARARCIEPERQQALIDWEEVELWILLHRVKRVRRADASYTVVVEPVKQGVQFVRLPRSDQLPLTFTFVTEEGQVVETIEEEDYRYWPGSSSAETEEPKPSPTVWRTVTPSSRPVTTRAPTSKPTRTPPPATDTPPFQVIYTCGRQLCLADDAGEVEELTEVPSSNRVTDPPSIPTTDGWFTRSRWERRFARSWDG